MGKTILEIKGTGKREAGGEQEKGNWSQDGLAQTRIEITFRIHSQKYRIIEEGSNNICTPQRKQNFKYCISDTSQRKGKKKKNDWTDKKKKVVNYLWLLK